MVQYCRFQMCILDEIRAKRDDVFAIAIQRKAWWLWGGGLHARREVVA